MWFTEYQLQHHKAEFRRANMLLRNNLAGGAVHPLGDSHTHTSFHTITTTQLYVSTKQNATILGTNKDKDTLSS